MVVAIILMKFVKIMEINKLLRREKDYGLHFCEIEALLAAKGELIHFCFDDDWMHPKYIEKSVSFFNEEIGMVYCDYELIDLDGDLIEKKNGI